MDDLGSLSQCLVDADGDERTQARRLRGKALVISVFLEVFLLAGLMFWQLITPGALPAHYVTSMPPYSSGGSTHHERSGLRTPRCSTVPPICLAVCAPVMRPVVPSSGVDTSAPNIDANSGDGGGSPGLPGPGIPGSIGDHPVVPEPPRPEPKPPAQPMRKSEGVMSAMLIHRVEPTYPRIAIAAHVSGTVRLHAIIGKDGSIEQLEVIDGNVLLAQAAKAAVAQWRYKASLLNGEPVEVETLITVNFALN